MLDILNIDDRKQIIEAINSDENKTRKAKSLGEVEIYSDNITPYVISYLSQFYSADTIKDNPVISCINICRRICQTEGSLYLEAPERSFINVSDEQAEALNALYKDICVDSKMLLSNRFFKLQKQNHIQPIVVDKNIYLRVLVNHNLDAIPLDMLPEKAYGYVISGYDKGSTGYNPKLSDRSNGTNEPIGDSEDYQSKLQRYAWFTKDYNFITDGSGTVVSGTTDNDIKNHIGVMPIVEVSEQKDLEYWQRQGAAVADFTVQFNAALTDLSQIVRMQGFSVAYLKGPKGIAAQDTVVGLNRVLKLEIDPANPVETEFGFASPSPDLAGSIQYVEVLLSAFLSSRGIDPKIVSAKGETDKFNSGIERLLAEISKFSASKSDIAVYEKVEQQLFQVLKSMINTYEPSGMLSYKIGKIPENAELSIKFKRPEMIKTDADKMLEIEKKLDLGLISMAEAVAIDRELPLEEAEKVLAYINKPMMALANPKTKLVPEADDEAEMEVESEETEDQE